MKFGKIPKLVKKINENSGKGNNLPKLNKANG